MNADKETDDVFGFFNYDPNQRIGRGPAYHKAVWRTELRRESNNVIGLGDTQPKSNLSARPTHIKFAEASSSAETHDGMIHYDSDVFSDDELEPVKENTQSQSQSASLAPNAWIAAPIMSEHKKPAFSVSDTIAIDYSSDSDSDSDSPPSECLLADCATSKVNQTSTSLIENLRSFENTRAVSESAQSESKSVVQAEDKDLAAIRAHLARLEDAITKNFKESQESVSAISETVQASIREEINVVHEDVVKLGKRSLSSSSGSGGDERVEEISKKIKVNLTRSDTQLHHSHRPSIAWTAGTLLVGAIAGVTAVGMLF
ncbi:hypothetical protein HK100_011504 [Physocladia obscura]|uniref:Uncharacterized protein n=1 Tax=Physocladia obscura TaxID=109957 RepID=A0AAD5XGV8_9FUNG|nr:hypothetical protein HK100_011504 [Physocladia obscura]